MVSFHKNSIAAGKPEILRFSSGITENNKTQKTRNLGELVREAKRKYSSSKEKKDRSKDERGYGIYRLHKHYNKHYKQGWAWRYTFKGKTKTYDFASTSLTELKQKVRLNHLMWRIYDEEIARKTAEEAGVDYNQIL